MDRTSLYKFLTKDILFQTQAMFEFRYPILFGEDNFLIEQLNFPKVDTNVGNVYLDGYKIPVHGTGQFDNEIAFTMYVDERDFHFNGKYFSIFNSLLNTDHILRGNNDYNAQINGSLPMASRNYSTIIATITPIASEKEKRLDSKTIILYNALIKSISLSGGFSSNASTLAKFDIGMTYAFLEHRLRPFEEYKNGMSKK